MPNFSATSDPESSLHSSDGAGNEPLWVDLLKRFIHLESQIDFLEKKNESSNAAYLKLENELRRQRRISEERDELKSNLEREVKTMEAKYDRLKEKYDTLREGSECGERKLKKQVDESRIKCCQLELDLKKLEMGLSAEFTEKLKAAEKLLDEKDETLLEMGKKNESLERQSSEMMKKIENLERQNSIMKKKNENLKKHNKKIQEVSVEVEKLVEEWEDHTASGTAKGKTSGCNVHDKGTENSKCLGPKSTGISTLNDPKQENIVADEQLTGPVIDEQLTDPKAMHIVLISDDEEEEKTKQTPSFASPSSAEHPPAAKRKSEAATSAAKRCKSNAPTDGKPWEERKSEAATSAAKRCKSNAPTDGKPWEERKSEAATSAAKQCKSNAPTVGKPEEQKSAAATSAAKGYKSNAPNDGKPWENAKQMLEAFKSNDELCMKSVCVLYRKHKSLGVWKNQSNGNKGFNEAVYLRGIALGEILTEKDPEGRMKKSVAELAQADQKGLFHCKFIAESHVQVLFEIYINNQDPFFP